MAQRHTVYFIVIKTAMKFKQKDIYRRNCDKNSCISSQIKSCNILGKQCTTVPTRAFCEIPTPLTFHKILLGNVPDPLTISRKLAARLRHLNLQYTPVYQILFLPDAIINTDDHTSSKSSLSFYKKRTITTSLK